MLFRSLCAPLPLAITAAAGPGLPGLCCVLGCGLGAFLFLPFQAGLRQLAAAILIFSGSIAFFDTKFFPRRFFRPGLAAALLLLVQSAYLIARPFFHLISDRNKRFCVLRWCCIKSSDQWRFDNLTFRLI